MIYFILVLDVVKYFNLTIVYATCDIWQNQKTSTNNFANYPESLPWDTKCISTTPKFYEGYNDPENIDEGRSELIWLSCN